MNRLIWHQLKKTCLFAWQKSWTDCICQLFILHKNWWKRVFTHGLRTKTVMSDTKRRIFWELKRSHLYMSSVYLHGGPQHWPHRWKLWKQTRRGGCPSRRLGSSAQDWRFSGVFSPLLTRQLKRGGVGTVADNPPRALPNNFIMTGKTLTQEDLTKVNSLKLNLPFCAG